MCPRRLVQLLTITCITCIGNVAIAMAEPARSGNPTGGDDARTLAAANGFLNRGHFDLAIQEYRRYLDAYPDATDADTAYYGLGVALFRSNKSEEAAAELSRLEQKEAFAFAAEVCMMLGQCRARAGEFAKAADAFRRLLAEHANHALADDAAAQLIEVLFRMSEDSEAASRCEAFLAKWMESPQLDRAAYFGGLAELRRNETAKAAARFKTLLEKRKESAFFDHARLLLARCLQTTDPSTACDVYKAVLAQKDSRYHDDAALGLAALLRLKGNFDAAAELLRPLVEKKDNPALAAGAELQLAHVEFGRCNYAAALKLFEGTASHPRESNSETEYWVAKCLLRLDRAADAASELDAVVKSAADSPLLPEVLYDLAVAQHRAGNGKAAAKALERLIDRFGDHQLVPSSWHLLAVIEHERGDFDASLKWTSRFLKKFADHELASRVMLLAAEDEYLLAHYDRAEKAFRAFLGKYPADPSAGTARYRQGMSLYHLEKYQEARPILEDLQKGDTSAFTSLYLALGDIAFRSDEWNSALKALALHLEKNAKPAAADEALLKCGICAVRLGNHDDAIRCFERLLADMSESPHALQARFERGQSYLVQASYEKAAADFDAVLKADEKSRFAPACRKHLAAIAMQRGDFASAARQYETLASEDSIGDKAESLYQQAMAQLSARDEAGAKKTLKKLLRKFEDSPRSNAAKARLATILAREGKCKEFTDLQDDIITTSLDASLQRSLYYERAWCLNSLGNTEDAAAAYGKLLEQSADDVVAAHALVELAEIEAESGHLESAAKRLDAFEKLESTASFELPVALREQALYRNGVVQFKLKQLAKAAASFDRFCKAFDRSELAVSAAYFQGESLFQTGDLSAAANCFDRVIASEKKGPELETSLLRAGDCRAKLQQWVKSEEAFEKFLAQFAASEQWYQAEFGLGWARENQGRHTDATKCYRHVVERHSGPTAARAQFQIGQCLFAQKKLDDAVGELLKVDILYAYPDWSAAALYEAGRCFEQMNKTAEAKEQFSTVVKKYKSTKWGELAAARLDALASIKRPGRGA